MKNNIHGKGSLGVLWGIVVKSGETTTILTEIHDNYNEE